MSRERLTLGILLAATFGLRAIHTGQPIVENYVGRQIPTAMVARNLDRGSGFLRPELDTGPFPNLFLVEPPIYAQVVAWVRPAIGFVLEPTGRLVSASAIVLAAWGLYGIARRREGPAVALLALASFSIFPVMVRYGRAFQPDALMLGCVLAGLRGWDEYEAGGVRRWAIFGGFVLATGLAIKITSAWALIPFALIVRRWPIAWRMMMAFAMLGPAFAWYLHAWGDASGPRSGSMASSDNAAIWIRTLSPAAWLRFSTYENIARGMTVRSFTPPGLVMAAWGLMGLGALDRVWKGWAVGCGLSVLILAAKWHHDYYWMLAAPLAAVGVGRGMVGLRDRGRSGRRIAAALGSFFLVLCVVQSASTWRTPAEWSSLIEAAREVDTLWSPSSEEFLIAPEALLYYADRRGFRLEFDPEAVRRAAGEWGEPIASPGDALALVRFYEEQVRRNDQGTLPWYARIRGVADVGLESDLPRRRAWRRAIRESPGIKVRVDRPDMLIAEFR